MCPLPKKYVYIIYYSILTINLARSGLPKPARIKCKLSRSSVIPIVIWCEDGPLVEFMHFVFTRMPGESYRRRLRSLLLCLRDVFRPLINSLVCWFFSIWLLYQYLCKRSTFCFCFELALLRLQPCWFVLYQWRKEKKTGPWSLTYLTFLPHNTPSFMTWLMQTACPQSGSSHDRVLEHLNVDF